MSNLLKNIKNLGKRFLGNINFANLKKGIQLTGNVISGLEHLKGNPLLGAKIKELTNSKVYDNVKKAVEIADNVEKAYERTKGLKIDNVNPINPKYNYKKMNGEGVRNALEERKKILNERLKYEKIQLHPINSNKKYSPPMNEIIDAERIANSMNYKNN
jgi:hypothetical protein